VTNKLFNPKTFLSSAAMDKLVCIKDFEATALKLLDNNTLQYYKSGADDEITLQDNKTAFKRYGMKWNTWECLGIHDYLNI